MVLYGSYGLPKFQLCKILTDFYSTFKGGKKNLDLYNKAAVVSVGCYQSGATLPAASFSQALVQVQPVHFILNQVHS